MKEVGAVVGYPAACALAPRAPTLGSLRQDEVASKHNTNMREVHSYTFCGDAHMDRCGQMDTQAVPHAQHKI